MVVLALMFLGIPATGAAATEAEETAAMAILAAEAAGQSSERYGDWQTPEEIIKEKFPGKIEFCATVTKERRKKFKKLIAKHAEKPAIVRRICYSRWSRHETGILVLVFRSPEVLRDRLKSLDRDSPPRHPPGCFAWFEIMQGRVKDFSFEKTQSVH